MKKKKKLLLVRANFDMPTSILSDFLSWKIAEVEKPNVSLFVHLHRFSAVREVFEQVVKDKDFVIIGGHGDYNKVTGQGLNVLWEADSLKEEEVMGKDIFTLACRCGRDLGVKIIESGANVYKGYRENFVFMYGGKKSPRDDEFAQVFILPAIERCLYMLDGRTPEEAEERANWMIEAFMEKYKKYPQVVRLLKYERNIQVFLKRERV